MPIKGDSDLIAFIGTHSNGARRVHCFFKNDKYHGELKRYYQNGKLNVHCFYKDGEYHGEFKSYFGDSDLHLHCFYNNGVKEEISEYSEDIENITDSEFMNITLTFGNNFFASKSFTGTAS